MDTGEGVDNPHRPLFHEEPAPLAFISSVMTPDLASVREQVAEAVEQANNIVPWAFEMSPASSEDVVEGYLEKVRSAAFVLLLVSESTSDPVISEVDEALAAGRSLLVFALPTEDRDERAQALLKRVKSSVRIRELANQDEIGDEVRVAVADEISRALSKRPGISKASRLAILWRIEILDRHAGEGVEAVQPDCLEVESSGRLHLTGGGRDEVQHGRVTSVYQTALETYEELAGSLFAGLAPFMRIAATLPARLDGHLYSRGPRPSGPDGFEWSLFARPFGERSQAEITVTKDGDPEVVEKWRKDWIAGADAAEQSLKALRPQQSHWISMGFQDFVWSGLGHLAMEEIVYGWLWSDLERIKLVSGRLKEDHYKTIP